MTKSNFEELSIPCESIDNLRPLVALLCSFGLWLSQQLGATLGILLLALPLAHFSLTAAGVFLLWLAIDNLQYGAWGEVKGGNTLGRASPFGFTGRWGGYTDARLGWVLNWNRWYGPEAGRWGSRDFVGIAGGLNLMGYTENNPLLYVDPAGFIKGDKTYGYPKDFWNWEHRRKEQAGDPDLSPEEAKAEYEEWKREGSPKVKDDKRRPDKKSKQCSVAPNTLPDFVMKTLADLLAQGMTLQQALQHLLDSPVNLPPAPNPPLGRPGSNVLGFPALGGGSSTLIFPPLMMAP